MTVPPFPYTVSTQKASIQPDAVDQPVDYMVEVRDPSNTVLTIISGKVRATDRSTGNSEEASYESCRTVYFREGKKQEVKAAHSEDLLRLVGQTMIAGTLPTLDTCPTGIASRPAPSVSTVAELWAYRHGD